MQVRRYRGNEDECETSRLTNSELYVRRHPFSLFVRLDFSSPGANGPKCNIHTQSIALSNARIPCKTRTVRIYIRRIYARRRTALTGVAVGDRVLPQTTRPRGSAHLTPGSICHPSPLRRQTRLLRRRRFMRSPRSATGPRYRPVRCSRCFDTFPRDEIPIGDSACDPRANRR